MSKRIVITGVGLITPLGVGVKTTWNNMLAGKSGLISTTKLPDYEENGWDAITSKVIGKVPEGSLLDGKWNVSDHMKKSESSRLALFSQYALAATQEALSDAKYNPQNDEEKINTGVAVGSGIGSFPDMYSNSIAYNDGGYRKVHPLFIPKLLTNMAAGNISIKYGLKGPLHSVSTACATGLHAIGDAYNFINNGYTKVMIAGGTEASIHPLALSGFARARSVVTDFNDSPEEASRPFDAKRNGFVLGEGSGILVIEELEHALNRGVKESDIYAEIIGYGLTGDAHHITAPMENGDGAFRAMKMALDRAKVPPQDVGYVNAHATSTVIGDRAENNAINELFTNNDDLSISANKASFGHLLGAAGAVESILTIKSIKECIIPKTLNLEAAGGHSDDDISKFAKFDYVSTGNRSKDIDYALCNSFGFGGVNSSICFKKFTL